MPGVKTWTTFWTNLMQHIRTPVGALSILLRMLDFIAVIVSQTLPSSGREMLETPFVSFCSVARKKVRRVGRRSSSTTMLKRISVTRLTFS